MENQDYGRPKVNIEQAVVSVAIIQSYLETIFSLIINDYSPLEKEIANTLRQLNFSMNIKDLIQDDDVSGPQKLSLKVDADIEGLKTKLAELKSQRPLKESDKEA